MQNRIILFGRTRTYPGFCFYSLDAEGELVADRSKDPRTVPKTGSWGEYVVEKGKIYTIGEEYFGNERM